MVLFEPFFDLYMKQLKLFPSVKVSFVSLGKVSKGNDSASKENEEIEDNNDPWALDVDKLKRYYLYPFIKLTTIHTLL